MNREKAGELAKVMQAYAEGKEVQCLEMAGWGDVLHPTFDPFFSWRIKPEPKRTAGYRQYYFEAKESIEIGICYDYFATTEMDWIEGSKGFIKWKHTEWQYDDVEVE